MTPPRFWAREKYQVLLILLSIFFLNNFRNAVPVLPQGVDVKEGFFGDGISYNHFSKGLPFKMSPNSSFLDRPGYPLLITISRVLLTKPFGIYSWRLPNLIGWLLFGFLLWKSLLYLVPDKSLRLGTLIFVISHFDPLRFIASPLPMLFDYAAVAWLLYSQVREEKEGEGSTRQQIKRGLILGLFLLIKPYIFIIGFNILVLLRTRKIKAFLVTNFSALALYALWPLHVVYILKTPFSVHGYNDNNFEQGSWFVKAIFSSDWALIFETFNQSFVVIGRALFGEHWLFPTSWFIGLALWMLTFTRMNYNVALVSLWKRFSIELFLSFWGMIFLMRAYLPDRFVFYLFPVFLLPIPVLLFGSLKQLFPKRHSPVFWILIAVYFVAMNILWQDRLRFS